MREFGWIEGQNLALKLFLIEETSQDAEHLARPEKRLPDFIKQGTIPAFAHSATLEILPQAQRVRWRRE